MTRGSLLTLLILSGPIVSGCGAKEGEEPDADATEDVEDDVDVADGPAEPDAPGEATCSIDSPVDGAVVGDSVEVEIGFSGPVAHVEFLVGGTVADETDVAGGAVGATFTWDTTGLVDGSATLAARVTTLAADEVTSDMVGVVVDNTAPTVSFGPDFPRIKVLAGVTSVPVTIVEDNVESVVLSSETGELVSSAEIVDELLVDTTTVEDGLHRFSLLVTDMVGRTAEATDLPVVVVNNGEHCTVTYDPGDWVYVPSSYMTVPYHTTGWVLSAPDVDEFISWLVWDASASWHNELWIGQGLSPSLHIQYDSGSSTEGEIILAVKRSELDPATVALLPPEEQTSDVFPHSTDTLGFGAYVGHVYPLEPAEHVEETLPITMGMVLLYAD
jgi:hypothetical protein